MWHSSQPTHDATNANSVADCLVQPVFFWEFKVGDSTWSVATDLKRHDHKVGPLQSGALIGECQYFGAGHHRSDHFFCDDPGLLQTRRIDIHQCNTRI